MLSFLFALIVSMTEFDQVFDQILNLLVLLRKMVFETIDVLLLLAQVFIHIIIFKLVLLEFAFELQVVILELLNKHPDF